MILALFSEVLDIWWGLVQDQESRIGEVMCVSECLYEKAGDWIGIMKEYLGRGC